MWLLACSDPFFGAGEEPLVEPPVQEDTAVEVGCRPDEDPSITAEELPFDPEVVASYRVSEVEVDPFGWDFSGLGGDRLDRSVDHPQDHWFADRFEGATHVAALDNAGEDLGVYRSDDEGLWLLGVASATPNWTALTYSPAVRVWSWPIAPGIYEDAEVDAEGLFEGEEYPFLDAWYGEIRLTHAYAAAVQEQGDLTIDAGRYEATRLHLAFEGWATNGYAVDFGHVGRQSWLFLAPCTGVVVRVGEGEVAVLGL